MMPKKPIFNLFYEKRPATTPTGTPRPIMGFGDALSHVWIARVRQVLSHE